MHSSRPRRSMIGLALGMLLGGLGAQTEAMTKAKEAAKAFRAQWRFGVAMRSGSLRPTSRSRYAKPGPHGTRKRCHHKKSARAARRRARLRG